RHAGRGRGRAGPGRRVASRAADPGRALHVSAAAPHQLLAPRPIQLPRHARTGSGGLAVTPVRNILRDRLSDRSARVGVIGLGYVGLPLAVEFARAGFVTTGIDLDARKVDAVNRGTSYIPDVPTPEVARLVGEERLRATADFAAVAELDTINICVPTPLRKTKDPDMSYIVPAVQQIAKHLHYGAAIDTIVPVSSPQAAEMVKLLENTFRMVNIGLVNEIALMCDRLGIDVWEVVKAAGTKPFGFMPFYPGPGLGGHCIPIDPF